MPECAGLLLREVGRVRAMVAQGVDLDWCAQAAMVQYVVMWVLDSGVCLYLRDDGFVCDCDCDRIWWTESRVRAIRRASSLGLDVGVILVEDEEGSQNRPYGLEERQGSLF